MLMRDFNEFAGKVVSSNEISDLLDKRGVSSDDVFGSYPDVIKKLRKAVILSDSCVEEMLSTASHIYINSRFLTKVEKAVLQEDTFASAKSSMQYLVRV